MELFISQNYTYKRVNLLALFIRLLWTILTNSAFFTCWLVFSCSVQTARKFIIAVIKHNS